MNSPRPRVLSRLLLVLAAVAVSVVGLVAPASAAPWCGLVWGSQPEVDPGLSAEGVTVRDVRAGQHECYDRLVVDLSRYAGFGGYAVEYAPVVGDNGVAVPLRGAADLRISVQAPAYDAAGNSTLPARDPREFVDVTGYQTFRQVAYAGSSEGYTLLGLGVRARLPFRVMVLPGAPGNSLGARLVIDVAHHW